MLNQLKKITIVFSIFLLLISACAKQPGVVWIASPWQQVLRSTPPTDQKVINLKSASNEYEPFRIIVHNNSEEKMEGITVTVSNLKANKDVISQDNIHLYSAHYLHITKPSRRTDNPADWYPDALIPFSDPNYDPKMENISFIGFPVAIDVGENAEIWCDLFVPPGTKPGLYKGIVTVKQGAKNLSKIPLNLLVWDFELPEKISMRSHLGSFNANSARIMGVDQSSQEFLELENLYKKELLKHRAMPSTPKAVWPEWDPEKGIIDRGESKQLKELIEIDKITAIDIPFQYYFEDPLKSKSYLKAMADWLRKQGYLDLAYVYLFDEPNNAQEYEIVRKQGALIREADPDLKRMCTEQTITSDPGWGTLYGAVDIWCPLWGLWDEPTAKERLENGEELWSYTALCQGPLGTPWWQIDTHPLNFRSPFWLSWKYNITGYLYWSSTYWNAYETAKGVWEAPYFRKDFWGEGMLLYPGQPVGIKGFVPSIRLKLYREAMEDYEYMVMAAEKSGKKDEVDRIINEVVLVVMR